MLHLSAAHADSQEAGDPPTAGRRYSELREFGGKDFIMIVLDAELKSTNRILR